MMKSQLDKVVDLLQRALLAQNLPPHKISEPLVREAMLLVKDLVGEGRCPFHCAQPCQHTARNGITSGVATAAMVQSKFDTCTESNCTRCRTHPNHRGDMEHAGRSNFAKLHNECRTMVWEERCDKCKQLSVPPTKSAKQRLEASMRKFDVEGPLPGMISAFEQSFGQSWTDPDWRDEASVWARSWAAARSDLKEYAQPLLLELLSLIHGDSGQYTERRGLETSVEDAKLLVASWKSFRERGTTLLQTNPPPVATTGYVQSEDGLSQRLAAPCAEPSGVPTSPTVTVKVGTPYPVVFPMPTPGTFTVVAYPTNVNKAAASPEVTQILAEAGFVNISKVLPKVIDRVMEQRAVTQSSASGNWTGWLIEKNRLYEVVQEILKEAME